MKPLPINQLLFKGTHNSYVCEKGFWLWGATEPIMNHPPHQQIDDFGVWVLELDIGVVKKNGQLRIAVGHNSPGNWSCWGYYLKEYLTKIRSCSCLKYRPIFLFFEVKNWSFCAPAETLVIAAAECTQAFEGKCIVLDDYIRQHDDIYPTVPELAGKAVIGTPPAIGEPIDACTSSAAIERLIEGACGHLRIDQYQADWTFEYGVPPNPIFVDNTAAQTWTVTDSQGSEWDCDNGDKSHNQTVHEQGTARFPFKTIRKAIMRAMGITHNTPEGDPRRAGYGWTLLVRPGLYPENVSITLPLTLRKDHRYPGEVVIGRP